MEQMQNRSARNIQIKLTAILRYTENLYYSDLLEINKSTIKERQF